MATAMPRTLPLLLVASTGCAMTVLDTNVVGVVLPTIARDLHASFADVEWVISSYVLCFAALLLPAGAIADRYGRRRVFLAGITFFALASLACGLAPSAGALYLARAAQGVGAAFLLAPALAIIGHGFHDPAARGRAWAIWGGIMGLTMVLSPLLGGLINQWLGWRWAFHVNLPLCALLAAAVPMFIEESRDPASRPLDLPGIGLFALAMFHLTWALIDGPGLGWASPAVLRRLGIGVALSIAFVVVERRRAHPMLDLRLFADLPFSGSVLAMFAYAATAQVMASLLPQFLQNGRGETALRAGLGMLPFALAMLVFPQVARRLSARMDSRALLSLGLAVVALGNLAMVAAATRPALPMLMLAMALLGTGGGLLNGETQKAIMGTVPPHRAGMASGISTTARFSGILIGFSGLGAVLAGTTRHVVEQAMPAAHLPVDARLIDHIVAGDLQRALQAYPADVAATVSGIARSGYQHGFAQAFLVAGIAAALAALLVWTSMRRTAPDGLAAAS
ncbi:MFS transporter [Stenotrophomonas sp. 24(2023)]|uniref:MFS transporter n=1 Tax=Stenotrophomonas sp. 24(2023) TaxID=3068324 RepID=UPI0027E079F7|nr:MFS transporter [Stenotrophomonas sp. 24(2023)]WMJ68957.1 MFS transporter [Stenotrophomonas sp. 24(2023)]